ncbi:MULTISPECIES: TIGR01458 family HAD-type hydrolase [Methylomicrobium]|uniref:Haloacid dehalogenase-like hydrolase domain-containing protein 2 n=1 Tax=Methylomicrobium album BG8 TaxID=686340 RepID=H8GKL9_METAL|nr:MULTISPECIES: TIGR01458 family HAD-type hydrolase [Methylomicrobium]EIC28027.1 HAD-superfamily subfamily IIA hydrolase, TIGR01458 [Methylomicrobium album BG8]
MTPLSLIRGILIDLDGVLYVGSRTVDGAIEAVREIKRRGYCCRFVTNTSTLSRASLHKKLAGFGFDIDEHEIVSAPQAALIHLRQFGDPVCHLLLTDDVKQDFRHLRQSDSKADFVIVGDIGNAWSYPLLNNVFNLLIGGAELIAIHKNRFWQTERGLQLDIGAFVSGLEYASRKQATIIGKPSSDFFKAALNELGMPPEQVAIVGDDIDADVGGGQRAGLTGILVKTGKYRQDYAENSQIVPGLIIPSVAKLPNLLPGL